MKEICALLFDFGGTLDGNGVHWRDRTYRFLKQEYPEIDREAFDRVDRASVEQLIAGGNAPTLTLRETADVISTGIYEGLGLALDVKDRYVDFFCEGVQASLDGNRRWLSTLRERYQLGVISNNFGNTQGWCDEYNLSPLLSVVIDSTVVGISKPETGIFQAALSALEVSPERAIYVGDTYSHDMVGAKRAGMWTAWLVGEEDKARPDASIVDARLATLQDLERFLEAEAQSS
ncbi:MAG: HAD family hydrolase [Candidatus Poribacteria bacterium]|nr:HAD family hydrolase [Candidatus Poribacteria bacterium]